MISVIGGSDNPRVTISRRQNDRVLLETKTSGIFPMNRSFGVLVQITDRE